MKPPGGAAGRALRPYWRWIAAGGAAGVLLFVLLAAGSRWTAPGPAAPATPLVTVVPLPSPTATPPVTPTPSAGPTEALPATPIPGVDPGIRTGQLVQVSGTEGEGLRLRSAPGLSAGVNLVALESEVFEVRGGPQEADGYAWFYLVNPFSASENGWAVATYLRPLDGP